MQGLDVERSSGNVVVSGLAPPEQFGATGVVVRHVSGTVTPKHTDSQTRAVVLVTDDAATAMRQADAVRSWAHVSLLPIVALLERASDLEHPGLWERVFTCACTSDAGHVLRLLADLDRDRDGLPSLADADLTWDLRRQLRRGAAARLGVGLDAFVAANTAFVGGLLRGDVDAPMLAAALDIPSPTLLNTTAVRTSGQPAARTQLQ